MTLEEYERQLAEKKANLNKQREAKAVNATEEFKGMKVSWCLSGVILLSWEVV